MYLSRLPLPGETVGNGRLQANIGGKGANQAFACHQAGADSCFVSCIGDDGPGRQICDQFQALGLNTSTLISIENCPTGTACILIDDRGENSIGLTAGANDELSSDLILSHRDLIAGASVLLLQLEIPVASVITAAKLGSELNNYVVLNPAPATELPEDIFSHIDLLTPNRGELASMTGMSTDTNRALIAAAESLIDKGTGKVIVTLGSDGALLVTKQNHSFYSPYPLQARDTTAAGDCFNGYLAAGIALTGEESLDGAISSATAAAAISVTREGAIPSLPAASEVEALMK